LIELYVKKEKIILIESVFILKETETEDFLFFYLKCNMSTLLNY